MSRFSVSPSTIKLTGVQAWGYHGVLESEAATGQSFIVDVEMSVDTSMAAQHDEVNYTVDYAEVAETIHRAITQDRFNLIETLAAVIAERLMEQQPLLLDVAVTVHKPRAPIPRDFANVSVTAYRGRA